MCKYFPNIRITEGNNFSLVLPLRSRTYVATKPIDEDIDPEQLENVVVTFGGVEYPAQRTVQGVQIDLPATLAVGTYNILLTADYLESSIRAAYESAITIVPWSAQSTAEQYIVGSPIVLYAAYVLSGVMTDAELEALKAELRADILLAEQAKADADAAKAAYDAKAEALDNMAQQTTLVQGVSDIREDITTLAKEVQVKDGNDTAISVGKEVRSELGTGSDTASETGTLFAVVKWGKDKVKAIYNAVTDSSNGLAAIKTDTASAASDAAAAKTAAQAITGYALQGNGSATQADIASSIGAPASGQASTLFGAIANLFSHCPVVQMTETTATLNPNVLYIWNEVGSLTLTLATPADNTIVNEYMVQFYAGSNIPTITFTGMVVVNGSVKPSSINNISILNGIAYIA